MLQITEHRKPALSELLVHISILGVVVGNKDGKRQAFEGSGLPIHHKSRERKADYRGSAG